MNRLINQILLLGGVVMAGVGIALARSNPINWAITAVGIGLVLLAFYLDQKRVKQSDAQAASEIADRIASLTKRPWMHHEKLEVPPSRKLLFFLLVAFLIGGSSAWLGFHATPTKWQLVVGGLFFLGLATFVSPAVLVGIGKPALTLDRIGFRTPAHGLIAWSYVEGIHLRIVENHGTKNCTLTFRVPDYAKAVASIHWSQRWLACFGLGGLRRGVVSVIISGGKDQPETIDALARHLWKRATSRDYAWDPSLSKEANDAFRRVAQFNAKPSEHDQYEHAIGTPPDQSPEVLRQLAKDTTLIASEVKQRLRLANWLGIIAIIGTVLALAWPWLKRWL